MTRNLFILFILFVFFPLTHYACDACGCGAGSIYVGAMPQFQKNYMGLRYRHFAFQSTESHANASHEQFQIVEGIARLYPLRNLQIQAFVPYALHQQWEGKTQHQLKGLGDISLLTSYQLIDTDRDTSICRKFRHSFFVGAGTKMATGNWQQKGENGESLHPNLQIGTGSWDALLFGQYVVRYQKWGLNVNTLYKWNTANAQKYRFGNQFSTNFTLFFVHEIGKLGMMLNLNTNFEHRKIDMAGERFVYGTGGYQLGESLEINLYFKRLTWGAGYQIPIWQNYGDNLSLAQNRFQFQAGVLF